MLFSEIFGAKSPLSVILISRYILGLGQRGRCCFCAACPHRKMYLEIRNENEGAFNLTLFSAGIPTECRAHSSTTCAGPQIPQSSKQDSAARAPVRLPGFELRPAVFPVRWAHPAHPDSYRSKTLPMPDLYAYLFPEWPPYHTYPDAHWREAIHMWYLRTPVRALGREETAR